MEINITLIRLQCNLYRYLFRLCLLIFFFSFLTYTHTFSYSLLCNENRSKIRKYITIEQPKLRNFLLLNIFIYFLVSSIAAALILLLILPINILQSHFISRRANVWDSFSTYLFLLIIKTNFNLVNASLFFVSRRDNFRLCKMYFPYLYKKHVL